MRQKILVSIFLCLIINITVFGQVRIEIERGCNFFGESIEKSVYSFDSDEEAESAVRRIMKYTGLPANFIIKAADVPNAEAVIPRQNNGNIYPKRLILYNQLFMTRVKNMTHTDWAAISILAHEIGHHLSGHTLETTGSRPPIELEADRFSGFILAKMGASLDEALIAINTITSDQPSTTHPGRQSRLAAITNGYKAAHEGNVNKPESPDKTMSALRIPQLIFPINNAQITYPRHTTLQWSSIENAKLYKVSIEIWMQHQIGGNIEWKWTDLNELFLNTRGGKYFNDFIENNTTLNFYGVGMGNCRWRVKAIGKDGKESLFSDWRYITYTN